MQNSLLESPTLRLAPMGNQMILNFISDKALDLPGSN